MSWLFKFGHFMFDASKLEVPHKLTQHHMIALFLVVL